MSSIPFLSATRARHASGAIALACALNATGAPAPVAPNPPGYPLFGGHPLEFERSGGKVVAVYMPNWQPAALVDALHGDSVTHVLYAFLHLCGPGGLPADASRCESRPDFAVAASAIDDTFDAAFARLKTRAPHVKVLASVGGWGGSDPFFHLANDAAKRTVFATAAAGFLRAHPSFDGIDIDWEHPTTNGSANGVALGASADGQGYADLVVALRAALDKLAGETGRRYLVTSAINTGHAVVDRINYRQAATALDLVFMMTYDFYGPWTKTAGNHAAPRSAGVDREEGLDAAVKTMTAAGVPAHKLVAGVAMYGRGFTGVAPPARGGSPVGSACTGSYPAPEGSATYAEIATRYLDREGRGRHGYVAMFDARTQAWNLYNARSRLFMGYDDPRAVLAKGAIVRASGLAGVFAWELSQDNGDILNAMNVGVGNALLRP